MAVGYRIGTAHFVDRKKAIRYYMPYFGDNADDAAAGVDEMLAQHAIFLGAPPVSQLKAGDRLVDDGTRYIIEVDEEVA